MEADLETLSPVSAVGPAPKHTHASSVSTLSTSRSNSTSNSTAFSSPTIAERRQRSSSNPDNGAVKRIVEHDSLVTVRLSEPPTRQLTLDTNVPATHGTVSPARDFYRASHPPGSYFASQSPAGQARRSLFSNTLSPGSISPVPLSSSFDPNEALSPVLSIPSSSLRPNLQDELDGVDDDSKTISGVEGEESDDEEVDWEELQKTEDAESKDNEEDTTAMLLARLEQENEKISANPKSVKVQAVERLQQESARKPPRPPSMAQLKHMVQGPQPAPLRYSMVPPPPMTDLEFYAALVKDYPQTAARLPTLLTNKIRKGIPPPLRGVVWQSMSGARDSTLEDQFDRFTGETSPYEGIIGKDLGRSFPGVEMFRDPDGDGQRMLGRVLKCYSLYDQKIGYCQGLALLVGPLLMHMSDKQAFCVLVKLMMGQYDLRTSFQPDLCGLHIKIYQFRELLRDNLPVLSDHLDELQVDPAAYVSQWFLSFFAVTCPLPLLFRVYDVIFAEGASETIMRVALSLMKRNMPRILAMHEFEDVLQFLLSRSPWDTYNYNGDDFVSDFVSLSPVVSRERLAALEQGYRERANPPTNTSANAARASEVSTAASRFLGRLWANSTTSLKASPTPANSNNSNHASNLTPGAASRPLSMLKRSASKQSLASTLNSMEASSSSTFSSAASVLSSASTDATSISRDSTTDGSSTLGRDSNKLAAQGQNSDSRHLHSQIEDLLTALSDLQRQHTLLADQLQQEREEREEDRKAVKVLLNGIKRKASNDTIITAHSADSDATIKADDSQNGSLSELLDTVEGRFGDDENRRRSSIIQTKPQMRDDIARAKEQLQIETSKSQDAIRRAVDLENEIASMKDQLRESHVHVRQLHTEKQRLEKQVHTMRVRASDSVGNDGGGAAGAVAGVVAGAGWLSRAPSTRANAPPAGLRELKLGRSQSTPSGISVGKRTSSMVSNQTADMPGPTSAPQPPIPTSEHDALLLELVQAKTAEAVARQEADEAKQKLEQLRKSLGMAGDHSQSALQPGQQQGVLGGMFRSFTSPAGETAVAAAKANAPVALAPAPAAPKPTPTPAATGGGGFWGWGKK